MKTEIRSKSKYLLVLTVAFLLVSCVTSPKEKTEVSAYNYSGRIMGSDIIIDKITDSILCLSTKTTIKYATGMGADRVFNSNTCDLPNALDSATHQSFYIETVKTDTMNFVERRVYHVLSYIQINWEKPILDSTWIPELLLTPDSPEKITWDKNNVRINYNSMGALTDSVKVPGWIRGYILFDYILKFNKKSNS